MVYLVVGIFVAFVALTGWFGRGSGRRGGDSNNWDTGTNSDGGHGGHHGGCSGGSGCSGGCGGGCGGGGD